MMTAILLACLLAFPLQWQPLKLGTESSLRGIAVGIAVGDTEAMCVVGAGPTVQVSEDGGTTWVDRTPVRDGVTDYRCVAILDGKILIIASAGTPALILRSPDWGRTWITVHEDTREAAFMDGVRFWDDQHGIAFGDPVDGAFLMLTTQDGGQSWQNVECDVTPLEGEAGFAASNGALMLNGKAKITVGLGGRSDGGPSRLLSSDNKGQRWSVVEVDEMPANASSGIFAIEIRDDGFGVAVGGDYKRLDHQQGNVAVTEDHGLTWRLPTGARPSGFRSSVVFVSQSNFWLATGPSGTDISFDGEDWRPLTNNGYHALIVTPDGTPIACGSEGRVAVLRSTP
jgi:photosystem II stability/assembly factor-like uncharacterized protein